MSFNAAVTHPIVLSIAGYDPSSGAGVTADIKTAAAHGCYAVTCITSLTIQSTQGVKRVQAVAGRIITETLEELASDLSIAAIRIGMLGSAEAVKVVAAFIDRNRIRKVVLDPVLRSSSGAELLSRDGVQALKDRLLPLAYVITPNIDEATALTGLPAGNPEEMRAAALKLHQMGARNVIVTGGHLDPPVDLLSADLGQGSSPRLFKGKKIDVRATHGTGCAFAMALACRLAQGQTLADAAKQAKDYVAAALRNAVPMGKGRGPIQHLFAGRP